jgi:hypothetical protein
LKSKIKKESIATLQNQWEQTTSHMLNIQRTTKRWESIKVFNCRAQVVITGMRIGHTHHMNDNCDTTLMVPYILYDSGLFGAARAKYGIDVTSLENDVGKNKSFLDRYWSHQPYQGICNRNVSKKA